MYCLEGQAGFIRNHSHGGDFEMELHFSMHVSYGVLERRQNKLSILFQSETILSQCVFQDETLPGFIEMTHPVDAAKGSAITRGVDYAIE